MPRNGKLKDDGKDSPKDDIPTDRVEHAQTQIDRIQI